MKRLLIGAVGLGKYEGTKYVFEDGSEQEADYFIYAVTQHIKPDYLMVVTTEKAKTEALPALQEWIALENVPVHAVDIPDGKNSFEAWAIFNAIVEKYSELFPDGKDQPDVYFDITNGMRSIPLLLLSVARYLQRSKKINLKGIFYGAFDVVERTNIRKPVYQLDSFVTVLDWANAVDMFRKTGNSTELAEMLDSHELGFAGAEDIAETLRKLSKALDLTRIEEIHTLSYELSQQIQTIDLEALSDENRVIVDLLKELQKEFDMLGMADTRGHIRDFLRKGLRLVDWYANRNRYQDAMLVAREWMITYKMNHQSTKNGRYPIADIFDRTKREKEQGHHEWLANDKKQLSQRVADVRNALAHGGMSDSDQDTEDVIKEIASVIMELKKLEQVL